MYPIQEENVNLSIIWHYALKQTVINHYVHISRCSLDGIAVKLEEEFSSRQEPRQPLFYRKRSTVPRATLIIQNAFPLQEIGTFSFVRNLSTAVLLRRETLGVNVSKNSFRLTEIPFRLVSMWKSRCLLSRSMRKAVKNHYRLTIKRTVSDSHAL